MTTIDELAEASRRLTSLLEEPEPGLFTWNAAVLDAWRTLQSLMENSGASK